MNKCFHIEIRIRTPTSYTVYIFPLLFSINISKTHVSVLKTLVGCYLGSRCCRLFVYSLFLRDSKDCGGLGEGSTTRKCTVKRWQTARCRRCIKSVTKPILDAASNLCTKMLVARWATYARVERIPRGFGSRTRSTNGGRERDLRIWRSFCLLVDQWMKNFK